MKKKMSKPMRYILWALNIIFILTVWTACSNKEETIKDESDPTVYEGEYSQLVQSSCLTCHAGEDGDVERISDVRKTPEGWDLTISRMENVWGLSITADEKRQIIKELSDKNGLAPEETESVMYWITREGTVFEDDQEGLFSGSCMRCHSIGQPLAQRRTEEEWEKLKDFHVAFNPSMIYQLRDIDWDEEAGKVIKYLQENYAFNSSEYENWMANKVTHDPVGEWRIVGISPTHGMYTGVSTFKQEGEDFYEERTITINGESITHKGNSILYGGYSLRTSMDGNEKYRGVYNFNKEGTRITGSMVKVGDTGIYSNEIYYQTKGNELLAAWPKSVQKGAKTILHLAGNGLPDKITKEQIQVNDQLEIINVDQIQDDLWVEVEVPSNVELSGVTQTDISIEGVQNSVSINLFTQADFIKVTPEYGLGRYGDEKGRKSVQFQAIGYSVGPDSEPNTEDDIELGPVDASWSMTNYSTFGEETEDDKYVGKLDPNTGMFEPAGNGPNPKREWSTNNAGGVTIHALYIDPVTGNQLTAEGFLLSTVPDFVPKVY